MLYHVLLPYKIGYASRAIPIRADLANDMSSKANARIRSFLQSKNYSPSTIDTYLMWVNRLSEYFPNTIIDDLSFDQVCDYINYLAWRSHYSSHTVHQAVHALQTVFNTVLGKNYDILSVPIPPREFEQTEVLTPAEIIQLLDSARNLKAKVIFATAYSSGLLVSEVRRIQTKDVDFDGGRLAVRDKRGKINRWSVLSSYLSKDLVEYINEYDPGKWLFEGKKKNAQYSSSAIQKSFKAALRKAGIAKEVTPRSLKYSYVHHLALKGLPLRSILRELKMATSFSSRTYTFYSRILTGQKEPAVERSSLDDTISDLEVTVEHEALERLLFKVQDEDVRNYLMESLVCLRTGANRASVIFAWTAAVHRIRSVCITHSQTALNSALKKHDPNARNVKKLDDFAYIKDKVLLLAARDLGEFDKNEKDALEEGLNLRNKCGHPGKYRPKPIKVAAFIEDIVTIVFE